jgi:hypothetical protein
MSAVACRRCGHRYGGRAAATSPHAVDPLTGDHGTGYCATCEGWLVMNGYAWDQERGVYVEPTFLFGDRPGPATPATQTALPAILDEPDDQQDLF